MSEEAGPSKRPKKAGKPHFIDLTRQKAIDVGSGPSTPKTPATATGIGKLNIDTGAECESAPPFSKKPHFFGKDILSKIGTSFELGLLNLDIVRGLVINLPIHEEIEEILSRQNSRKSLASPISKEEFDIRLEKYSKSVVGKLIFNIINMRQNRNKLKYMSAEEKMSSQQSTDSDSSKLLEKPTAEERVQIIAAMETHKVSRKLLQADCFEVSTELVHKTDPEFMAKLGWCVKFIKKWCHICKELPKKFQNELEYDMNPCYACPHTTECNCNEKFEGTKWCPHLHLWEEANLNVFEDQVCLYVDNHISYKMENRHFRALVIGCDGMVEAGPNTYIEKFQPNLNYSEKIVLHVKTEGECSCEKDGICPRCGACTCRYRCTCVDYWSSKQVCTHIHIVAMRRNVKNGEALFRDFEEFDITGPEVFTVARRESVASRQIDQYHCYSYCIRGDKIIQQSENSWLVGVYKPGNEKVGDYKIYRNPHLEEECVCISQNFPIDLCCLKCRICKYHFLCSCKLYQIDEDPIICMHVHALQQSLTPIPDPDDLFGKIKILFPDFNPDDFLFRKREPIPAVSDTPSNVSK